MTFQRCVDHVFSAVYQDGSIGLKLDDGPNFMHKGIQVHGVKEGKFWNKLKKLKKCSIIVSLSFELDL